MVKSFKTTLGIFAALAVAAGVFGLVAFTVCQLPAHPFIKSQADTTPWSESVGAFGIPNQGITYLNHPGRYYGADYCNVDGYGVPAGQFDYEDGRNWLNDTDCAVTK